MIALHDVGLHDRSRSSSARSPRRGTGGRPRRLAPACRATTAERARAGPRRRGLRAGTAGRALARRRSRRESRRGTRTRRPCRGSSSRRSRGTPAPSRSGRACACMSQRPGMIVCPSTSTVGTPFGHRRRRGRDRRPRCGRRGSTIVAFSTWRRVGAVDDGRADHREGVCAERSAWRSSRVTRSSTRSGRPRHEGTRRCCTLRPVAADGFERQARQPSGQRHETAAVALEPRGLACPRRRRRSPAARAAEDRASSCPVACLRRSAREEMRIGPDGARAISAGRPCAIQYLISCFLHADRRVVVDRKERLAAEIDVAFFLPVADVRATVGDRDLGVRREQAVVPAFDGQMLRLTACGAQLERRRQVDRRAAISELKG